MTYYFNKTLKAAFEEAVVRTTDAFKAECFGVLALFQALAAAASAERTFGAAAAEAAARPSFASLRAFWPPDGEGSW